MSSGRCLPESPTFQRPCWLDAEAAAFKLSVKIEEVAGHWTGGTRHGCRSGWQLDKCSRLLEELLADGSERAGQKSWRLVLDKPADSAAVKL